MEWCIPIKNISTYASWSTGDQICRETHKEAVCSTYCITPVIILEWKCETALSYILGLTYKHIICVACNFWHNSWSDTALKDTVFYKTAKFSAAMSSAFVRSLSI